MLRTSLVAATFFAIAASAGAQAAAPSVATIDPGMTKDQVIEKFGKPATTSTRGTFMYLFFANGNEKTVGMSDIVILDDNKVVDAVLRSPSRAYSGTSSSPRAIPAAEAAKANPKKGAS
jgi:outer membrane protein assembly factor BamE (lipoprotein component of BamABCDE complex)